MSKKAWGGRFQEDSISWVEEFNASIHFDKVLIEEDINGSIAHANMLAAQNIISEEENSLIKDGLMSILDDYNNNKLVFSVSQEDIHMNVEAKLIEKIGAAGGKLHTARSRNDQVATDMHLYVKKKLRQSLRVLNCCSRQLSNLQKITSVSLCPATRICSVPSRFYSLIIY
jgi:Argininosuccinate lyase